MLVRLRPCPPYRLDLSARGAAGGTRTMRGGVLRVALRPEGGWALATVRQRPDSTLEARIATDAPAEAAHDALRFALALDVDHREFLRRARHDRLLGPLLSRLHGLRPMRLGTPAQALARALAGQLVASGEGSRVHARLVRACAPERAGLRLPPTAAELSGLSPARARACGLAARRAAALPRLARTFDLGALGAVDASAAVRRICQERQLGPWSAGVLMLYGLGRYEQGLVGDLGLVRLLSHEMARRASPEETAELLRPFGPWAGLASVYLLQHPLARRRGPVPTNRGARPRPAPSVPAVPEGGRRGILPA